MNKLAIPDTTTGELIPIEKATDMQLSLYLTEINHQRKIAEKIERKVKDYIKKQRIDANNFEEGSMEFGNHKIKTFMSFRFSEKLLKEKGTKKEQKLWKELKRKYTLGTQIVTI